MKLLFTFFYLIISSTIHAISYSPELQPYFQELEKLPEAHHLLYYVQEVVPLKVIAANQSLPSNSRTFFDADRHILYVNFMNAKFEGEIIGALLLELHQILMNPAFEQLEKQAAEGKIDKKGYIEAVMQIEYQNAVKASRMVDRGIQWGIFPNSARLPYYRDLDDYLLQQKINGHSIRLTSAFDRMTSK